MQRNGVNFTVALVLASAFFIGPAFAGCINCGGAKPGKGCDQMVTLKHPDMKPGPERRKEWKKCMADPASYNG